MPTHRAKKIKWMILIVTLILGLMEVVLLAYNGEIENNLHEMGCSTFPSPVSIRGRVIDSETELPITGASVTIQHLKRLNWTCEVYDTYPPLVVQTNELGAFVTYSVEQDVQVDITITAVDCQMLIDTISASAFLDSHVLPGHNPSDFKLHCLHK